MTTSTSCPAHGSSKTVARGKAAPSGAEFFFTQNEKRARSLTRDKAAEAMQQVCTTAGERTFTIGGT